MLCNATFSPSNSTKAQPTPIIIKQCQNFACICVMMFLSVIFGSVYIFLHMFDWENNYWLFLFTIAIISIELYFSLFEQDSLFWDSPSPAHHNVENWKCQYTFLSRSWCLPSISGPRFLTAVFLPPSPRSRRRSVFGWVLSRWRGDGSHPLWSWRSCRHCLTSCEIPINNSH